MSQLHLLLMLHIISAVVWIGGMITIRLVIHPINLQFEDLQQRVERNLKATKRLLVLAFPFVLGSFVSGFMITSANFSSYNGSSVYPKIVIWLLMFLNYMIIFYRSRVATRSFNNLDITGARRIMSPVANLLLPINIILGIVAIYIGINLRGV
ncbi:MAG: hypothetical protein PHI79_00545 [Sulfurovaceae bacterium]|nr:hypothetical protein [Sulfurovaceae bacterium]MDD5548067.1 hypothetical protein [Sulfurovaceae bacterium]